jgi:3-phenylpropionate/trans-cinnamate dioxygenase ferredoxin reductase component
VSHAALVVIGGGPAGLAAARGYRDGGGRGVVVILAREPHPPYGRPPLTKDYLRGELDRTELLLEAPRWFGDHEVLLETGVAALALDPVARLVHTQERGALSFEHCVLATGARPQRPDLPGADDPAVQTVRTVEDSDALQQLEPGTRVIVVGSGFIGCEAAVSLAARGLRVELMTDEEQPQARRLGDEVGDLLAGWLREAGVSLRLGRPVAAIAPGGRGVVLESGERLEASTVVLALGIEPDIELGRAAGLEVESGRLLCDESGRTSAERVLAAGDAARLLNPVAGRHLGVEHWGEALAQGELAGRTAAGSQARWEAVPGFWSTIGKRTIKQAAWGDGHDEVRLRDGGDGWTAWYGREGRCVGVLTHQRDEDYERGSELVAAGAPLPR